MRGSLAPIPLIFLTSCWIERVTGEAVPLDPAYTAGSTDDGEGNGSSAPFAGAKGPTVLLSGVVSGEGLSLDLPVDVTVQRPDPAAPGGMKSEGKIMLDGPGAFSLKAPVGTGELSLQAFQDPDTDGPGGQDPFGQISVVVADVDQTALVITLVPGGRGGGPTHTDAPPGAPGGTPHAGAAPPGSPTASPAPPGAPGGAANGPAHQDVVPGVVPHGPGTPIGPPPAGRGSPGAMPPFADLGEAPITMEVDLRCAACTLIDLDLFVDDPSKRGGRRHIGKLKEEAGLVKIKAPRGYGRVHIEAFCDRNGDGPGMGDPMGIYLKNPVSIENSDIKGIVIELAEQARGQMPQVPGQGRPGAPPVEAVAPTN
jgi:hypothetical protein